MLTDYWYWGIFALTVLLFIVPYLLFKWEEHQNRRDAQIWERLHHGDTFSRRVDQ